MSTSPDFRLNIVRQMLSAFDQKQVVYCHWKSNEHLRAAVQGDTDLDILFASNSKQYVVDALTEVGFIRYKTVWYLEYAGIEDYLAIDPVSGKVVHVHAHFNLIVGEKRTKGHHLPWEELVLSSRVQDEDCQIFRAHPTIELLLLLTRLSLKSPARSRSFPKTTQKNNPAWAVEKEFAWLKSRVNLNDLRELTRQLLGEQAIIPIENLYNNGLHTPELSNLFPILAPFSRFNWLQMKSVRFTRGIAFYQTLVYRRLGFVHLPTRRTLPKEGLIVTLLGPDGSGKSTQTKLIHKHLAKKIDTRRVYLGSGDGKRSFLRTVVETVQQRISKSKQTNRPNRSNARSDSPPSQTQKKRSLLQQTGFILRSASLAREKKKKLNRVVRFRRKGMIVICDRYPQMTVHGYNDGLLLSEYQTSDLFWLRWLAIWEKRCYTLSAQSTPDLVLKLIANPETLAIRRPEMNPDHIVRKRNAVLQIEFPNSGRVEIIDSNRPLEEVTICVMNHIAQYILEQNGATETR
jgi:thymidylate kinase